MVRSEFHWSVLSFFIVVFEFSHASAAFAADGLIPLPRYSLEVGHEITYSGWSDFKFKDFGLKDGRLENRNEWKVWVVRKNDDGSHRVVLSFKESTRRDGKDLLPDVTLAYCDLFSDGRIIANPSLGYNVDPILPFPRLPADRKEIAGGWVCHHAQDEGTSYFKVVSQPGTRTGTWSFQEVRENPYDEIALKTHKSTITFDSMRGLVTNVNHYDTDGWAFKGKGNGRIELLSVENRDAGWIKQLWEETHRYVEAKRAYEAKLRQASRDAQSSKERLDEAKTILTAARAAVSLAIVKEPLDNQIRSHNRRASARADEARRRAKRVGRPAPVWEAVDLNGIPHSLENYRGKVVILDFWDRGCGTCTKTLPLVNKLAARFRGQPVVVLGMNFDKDEADAKFVVDKIGLEFATLKIGMDLLDKYDVHGVPTFVIVDQRGEVQDVRFGYWPTLQSDLGDIVQQLLAKG
jgi:thiol-disulfide isomerase/thioredoxin